MMRRMHMNMFLMLGTFHLIPVGIDNTVRVNVKVNDDAGMPVKNAIVAACTRRDRIDLWTNSSSESRIVKERTDKEGKASLVFPCYSANFRLRVSADGYYAEAPDEIQFKTSGAGAFSMNLAEYEKNFQIKLYRKKNPIPMFSRSHSEYRPFVIQQGQKSYEYDLEKCDFLPPYGKGVIADLRLEVERYEKYPPLCTGRIIFIKGGAYKVLKNKTSDLKSVYHADTNAVYVASYRFSSGRNCERIKLLTNDEYFVFRVREMRNENGELLSAHYGKIYGAFDIGQWLYCQQCTFNPNPNDTNLEVDPKRNLYNDKRGHGVVP